MLPFPTYTPNAGLAPPVLTYVTTSGTNNNGDRTFSAVSIGAAAADRYIIVGVHTSSFGSNTITGVTVAGITATKVAEAYNASYPNVALFIAAVPTGTSATIAVTNTTSSLVLNTRISVWNVTGLSSATPIDIDENAALTDAYNPSLTADDDAIAICLVSGYTQTPTYGWSGTTERYELVLETSYRQQGADATGLASSGFSPTMTITGTPGSAASVIAVWR